MQPSNQQTTAEELTATIAALVSRETENPPGNERQASEFIQEWFTERGIDAELVQEPYDDRPQVAARVGDPTAGPTIVLNGHLDVVPAGNEESWSHAPYGAEVSGGKLYGRGSTDMKTGVAIGMHATAALQAELDGEGGLDGAVVFQGVIGEETAEPGTKALLENGWDGDYGIVLEPTGMRTATSEKGLAWYEITVEGEPSHASRPDQGENAVMAARLVLDALADYDSRVRKREDELVGQAYATVTQVEAGTKENVVPEDTVLTIDRRFLPAESAEEIDEEIEAVCQAVRDEYGVTLDWQRTRTYESAAIPIDSPLAELLREHSRELADVSPEPWGVQASTDVRNFVNDAGIEAVTWGPGDLAQAHTYDEHVDLDEAATGLDVLTSGLRELLADA